MRFPEKCRAEFSNGQGDQIIFGLKEYNIPTKNEMLEAPAPEAPPKKKNDMGIILQNFFSTFRFFSLAGTGTNCFTYH